MLIVIRSAPNLRINPKQNFSNRHFLNVFSLSCIDELRAKKDMGKSHLSQKNCLISHRVTSEIEIRFRINSHVWSTYHDEIIKTHFGDDPFGPDNLFGSR